MSGIGLRACLLLAIGFAFSVFAARARAATTFDYAADPGFAVSLDVSRGDLTLRDFISLCETAGVRFVYREEELPMEAPIVLQEGRQQPLYLLLWATSTQTGVVFQRLNGHVGVRVKQEDDTLTPPPELRAEQQSSEKANPAPSDVAARRPRQVRRPCAQ